MKIIFQISLIYLLFGFSSTSAAQNLHPNNRTSLVLGGPTAFLGIQYEHFFPISKTTSISTGLGVGFADIYLNFSLPVMFNYSVTENHRFGLGLAYTYFPHKEKHDNYEDSYVQDALFLVVDYSFLPTDSQWEYTVGYTPLREVCTSYYGSWAMIKASYVFTTSPFFKNSIGFRKKYNLRTR